jgi:cytochrome c oxidase assembly factor CtaG
MFKITYTSLQKEIYIVNALLLLDSLMLNCTEHCVFKSHFLALTYMGWAASVYREEGH